MLNKQTYTKCRKCQSNKLEYFKTAGYGEKAGMVYHYKAKCLDCNFISFVKRTQDIFFITQKQGWVKSKSLKDLQKDGA